MYDHWTITVSPKINGYVYVNRFISQQGWQHPEKISCYMCTIIDNLKVDSYIMTKL